MLFRVLGLVCTIVALGTILPIAQAADPHAKVVDTDEQVLGGGGPRYWTEKRDFYVVKGTGERCTVVTQTRDQYQRVVSTSNPLPNQFFSAGKRFKLTLVKPECFLTWTRNNS